MPVCSSCGRVTADQAGACSACGAALAGEGMTFVSTSSPSGQQPPGGLPSGQGMPASAAGGPRRSRHALPGATFGLIVLGITLAACGFIWFFFLG